MLAADAVGVTTNGIVKRNGLATMGAGVALAARKKFPGIDKKLATSLRSSIGNCTALIWWAADTNTFVFSFPTKEHWRNTSILPLIARSARDLARIADLMEWETVYLPRPGCANGGLNWSDVEPILDKYLDARFTIVYL